MTVTIPVTVYVPDLVVQRVSIEGDVIVGQFKFGAAPKPWTTEPLKEEARTLLMGLPDTPENKQMYSSLMFAMRQGKRVLGDDALREFLKATRPDAIAAFVQKYGLFKHPGRDEPEIRVSMEDFQRERTNLHALLKVWALLREGEVEQAVDAGKDRGLAFAGDPHFALSVHLSAKLLHRSTLTLIAKDDRLEPVLYCHDVITGLYGLWFQAVVSGRPWAICLNCNNAYTVQRVGKKFCSESCQQTFKQRRYRESLKQKNRKSRKNRRR